MCESCDRGVKHGVAALEALANGEDIPEPAAPDLPSGALPIPMLVADMGDKVGIMTSREGWAALKALMALMGGMIELPDDD